MSGRIKTGNSADGHGLAFLVSRYRRECRPGKREHQCFYASRATLDEAIEVAALAKRPDGKRHNHQRRIPPQVLVLVRDRLRRRKRELLRAANFDDLMRVVGDCAVKGFGELSIYDTALRLGAYLKIVPGRVYLHAGVRKGAQHLGLDHRAEFLTMDQLPPKLRRLKPDEVEDFLCIFKRKLGRLGRAAIDVIPPGGSCRPRRPRIC